MKWQDLTPLFSLIVALVFIGTTAVLAIQRQAIPDTIKYGDAAIVATYFVASAARGTTPPGGGK